MVTATLPFSRSPHWLVLYWLRTTAMGAVALLVVLIPAGALYQWIGQSLDAQRFPQQGRSVALGSSFPGVSLSINCTGQGSPVVVLESGAGVPAVGWSLVQPEIAKFTRVCSYDRAGYGWSDPGPLPRTSLEVAKELHALLIAAGEKPPYVLVAHSLGGFNARVYNHEYPSDVAGMVLVDASHEDQLSRMPPAMRAFLLRQRQTMHTYRIFAPLLTRFGVVRFLSHARVQDDPDDPTRSLREEMRYLDSQLKSVEAFGSEADAMFDQSAEEVRAAGNLGDKPLIVLTAGEMDQPPVLPRGVTQKDLDDFHKMFMEDLQVQETHLSTRGRQVIVPDSHHLIPLERPEAIVSAAREVCAAVDSQ